MADFLSENGTLALSLTCKRFFVILFKRPSFSQDDTHRTRFLLRLERDLGASHFFCTCCIKLHSYTSLPGPGHFPWRSLQHDCITMGFNPIFSTFRLCFYQARLIMNRYFYGPPSGFPLEMLDLVVGQDLQADPDDPKEHRWTAVFTANVIKDELVLLGTHSMDSPASALDELWEYLEPKKYWVCFHDHLPRQLGYGYCDNCLTDYAVEIRTGSSGKLSMTVYSYHLIGSARHHRDWKWQILACGLPEPRDYWLPPRRDLDAYPPGFVRELWSTHADRG